MSDESKIKIFRPFGPSVAKIELSNEMIDNLNSHIDKIIENEKVSKKLDVGHNLAGNVKQEFYLEPEILESSGLLNLLASSTKKWIQFSQNMEIKEFNIISSWVVRQFENEYNPVHYHSGHISGVGYLKLPNNYGETIQSNKKKNLNGQLSLIHGSKMFNSESVFDILPKVGDFYLFPNYMMHSVYPFYGKDERRSLSFNAKIDEKIYNIS